MNKKLLYGLAIPLFAIVLVAAAWYVNSVNVIADVKEPLSIDKIELDFTGYAGECITKQISIDNAANGNVPAQLTWVLISNPNGVTYTTDMPKNINLAKGNNLKDVKLCYDAGSARGSISGNVVVSRGSGDITGIAKFTQKNLDTWEPIVDGTTAEIEYTVLGSEFVVNGIPPGYTLVYYPNTEGDVFATNIANVIALDEGANNIPSLPIALDVGDDYCTNGYNPDAKVCNGAKLWLIPGDGSNLNSWIEPEDYLFETDLITYTKTI